MAILALNIDPDQASFLAMLAQQHARGGSLSDYRQITGQLTDKSYRIARVLFGERITPLFMLGLAVFQIIYFKKRGWL